MSLPLPHDAARVQQTRRRLTGWLLAGSAPVLAAPAADTAPAPGAAPGVGSIPSANPAAADLAGEVRAHELAFAATMQRRDLRAFAGFIAPEASFLNGGRPLRGRERIVEHWARFFQGPQAPFEWAPDLVEVLPDGSLAMTLGPVRNAEGAAIARFYSVWRREAPGVWKVVFDNGYDTPACPPPAPAPR